MARRKFCGDTRSGLDQSENQGQSSLSHSEDSPLLVGNHKLPIRKSRKSMQKKKVVLIPIKDLDSSCCRTKGEAAPPSDTWAWRKYGQKPIKGSPFPRGYYRCSSSKGCPARKQVERSGVDPTMLVVTYSSDHNHPWPPSSRARNHSKSKRDSNRHLSSSAAEDGGVSPDAREAVDPDEFKTPNEDFHGWFGDVSYATMLDGPMLAETSYHDADVAMSLLPITGEVDDESFFADLGELPECSMVFRRRDVFTEAAAGGARWCGVTS